MVQNVPQNVTKDGLVTFYDTFCTISKIFTIYLTKVIECEQKYTLK